MKKKPWHIGFDSVVDPDFDELGGELTLEQIRHPTLSWAQCWNPKPSYADGDPLRYAQHQREAISHRRYRLRQLFRRLKTAYKQRIPRAHERLNRLSTRLQAAANFEAQIKLKRELLQRLSERFLQGQLKDFPKFSFTRSPFNYGYNAKWSFVTYDVKCNRCIPYNGHHTPNYWATGQKDCW